jgi:hypothetical protein
MVFFTTIFLAIAWLAVVKAAPPDECSQVLQNVDNLAADVIFGANIYWTHRKSFVEFRYDPSHSKLVDAPRLADLERSKADLIKATMPIRLANFQELLGMAQSLNCLEPAELRVIREKTTNLSRRVTFDRFPQDEDKSAEQIPTRMAR